MGALAELRRLPLDGVPVDVAEGHVVAAADAKLRVQMRAEIYAAAEPTGDDDDYVTHDQVEAMTMGDRVAVMRKGELQQVVTPQELYDHPVELFVGGFIASRR